MYHVQEVYKSIQHNLYLQVKGQTQKENVFTSMDSTTQKERKTNALKLSVPPWRSPADANRSVHPSDGPTFAGGHWGHWDLDHRIT